MSSPTQRTLEYLRNQGYEAGVVERFLMIAGRIPKRFDLFGAIDVIAVHPDKPGCLGVQCCPSARLSDHRELIRNLLADGDKGKGIRTWLHAGNRLSIFSWRLGGPRGKRKTWIVTETEIC
jgi:hypothetical protein